MYVGLFKFTHKVHKKENTNKKVKKWMNYYLLSTTLTGGITRNIFHHYSSINKFQRTECKPILL